ncbi:ethanolaminephosphotransferase 1-like isoform X1 [Branchiostoma floridae x Branchiostoma japonicum]
MATSYLTDEHIAGFDRYKYCSVDTSPLSNYVMHPFWNAVVKRLPRWLAPNLMTFVGFLLLIFNFALLTWYDPQFRASSSQHPDDPLVPNWVWLVCGFAHFLSHTLDGCDGKQARRTGSSSPLGELFDHGLDSWATMFFPTAIYSMFGRGTEYGITVTQMYMVVWVVMIGFIMSHWEKYNTGTLFLPWGYDMSQVCMLVMYIAAFFCGQDLWRTHLPMGLRFHYLFLFSFYGGFLFISLPHTIGNLYRSTSEGTGRNLSLYEGMLPLLSPVLLFLLCVVWLKMSPTDILEQQPRLFYFMSGTVFANIACRLIIAQMSNTRCEGVNALLWPLMLIVAGVCTVPLGQWELVLLIGYTVMATLLHIHFGVCVVLQMADHFQINVFTITGNPDGRPL